MKTVNIILTGVIVVLLLFLFASRMQIKDRDAMINDNEIKYSQINGKQQASIEIIQLERIKDFKRIKSKDSTIQRLQELTKNYKGNINTLTSVVIELRSKGASKSETVFTDTVVIGDSIFIFPTYYSKWNDKWSSGEIKASKDSVWRDFKVIDDVDVIHGLKRQGFFKQKILTVDVISNNPNSKTKELKSIQFKQKQNRFGLGLNTGVGWNILENKPCIYIGAGGHLRIF